jgi:hypothetical protein
MYPEAVSLFASSVKYMKRTLIHQLKASLMLQNVGREATPTPSTELAQAL